MSASPQALLLAGVGMQVTHVAIQERAQMPQCCQHKAAVKEKKNLGFPFFSFLQHSCFTSPCSCSFCSGTSCDCLCFPGSLLAQREWRTCLLRDGTGSCRCSFPPRTHPLLLKIWLWVNGECAYKLICADSEWGHLSLHTSVRARRLLENGNCRTGFHISSPSICWSVVINKKKKKGK